MNIEEILDYRKTDREWFKESFLTESPQKHEAAEYFDNLNNQINELMNNGFKKEFVSKINGFDLFKIELESMIYYWFEQNNESLLIIELDKTHRTLLVRLLGKKGKGLPYAVDLYLGILNDIGESITITSDYQLTEKGLDVWKRLFDQGHKVIVYDTSNVGTTWKTLSSANDLELYFGDDPKYRNYRYVLSENRFSFETKAYFRLRQTREENGSYLGD